MNYVTLFFCRDIPAGTPWVIFGELKRRYVVSEEEKLRNLVERISSKDADTIMLALRALRGQQQIKPHVQLSLNQETRLLVLQYLGEGGHDLQLSRRARKITNPL